MALAYTSIPPIGGPDKDPTDDTMLTIPKPEASLSIPATSAITTDS